MCIIWGMKAVCLTGNRPHKMPYAENSAEGLALKERLCAEAEKLICEGYTHFISGMALGADMYFAECVLRLKETHGVTLEAAVPYPGQSDNFTQRDKQRYDAVLSAADKKTVLCESYTPYCFAKRNKYMVDSSDVVLAVCFTRSGGAASTVRYAASKGKRIINLAD